VSMGLAPWAEIAFGEVTCGDNGYGEEAFHSPLGPPSVFSGHGTREGHDR
jgi:hypothetical protein